MIWRRACGTLTAWHRPRCWCVTHACFLWRDTWVTAQVSGVHGAIEKQEGRKRMPSVAWWAQQVKWHISLQTSGCQSHHWDMWWHQPCNHYDSPVGCVKSPGCDEIKQYNSKDRHYNDPQRPVESPVRKLTCLHPSPCFLAGCYRVLHK